MRRLVPRVVVHRGASAEAAEHTLAAYLLASAAHVERCSLRQAAVLGGHRRPRFGALGADPGFVLRAARTVIRPTAGPLTSPPRWHCALNSASATWRRIAQKLYGVS